jgi:flavin-dependent dehydrogenase
LALEQEGWAGPDSLPSYGVQSIWGAPLPFDHDFIVEPGGERRHVNRLTFDGQLLAAAQQAGAHLEMVRRVQWAAGEAGWQMALLGATGAQCQVAGAWVVDCTGRAARFARSQGASRVTADRLVACSVRLAVPERDRLHLRTRLEAVADGWWYLAPAPPDEAALTFLTDGDLPAARVARSPAGLAQLLAHTRAMQGWVAELGSPLCGPVQCVAAGSAWLCNAAGPGWLATGDAALAFDPLAGVGVLSALQTGVAAGHALLQVGVERTAAFIRYQVGLTRRVKTYRDTLRQVYCAEPRWLDSPFWQRRSWSP